MIFILGLYSICTPGLAYEGGSQKRRQSEWHVPGIQGSTVTVSQSISKGWMVVAAVLRGWGVPSRVGKSSGEVGCAHSLTHLMILLSFAMEPLCCVLVSGDILCFALTRDYSSWSMVSVQPSSQRRLWDGKGLLENSC